MLRTTPGFDRIGEENAFAVLARAQALAAQGRDIINLGIGQPDFRTPDFIVEAAIKALRDGTTATPQQPAFLRCGKRSRPTCHRRQGVEVSGRGVMIMPGGKPVMFMSILMFGEPGADIPLSGSWISDLSLDDRVHRRTADPGADPRTERLRLFRRRNARIDHAADAAADPQFAG